MLMVEEVAAVEQECLRYGFTQEDWAARIKQMEVQLVVVARTRGTTITYRELARRMVDSHFGLPINLGDPAEWAGFLALIDSVSTKSYVEKGVLLGAVVWSGSGEPNFTLAAVARRLNLIASERDYDEVLAFMAEHANDVNRAYSRRAR